MDGNSKQIRGISDRIQFENKHLVRTDSNEESQRQIFCGHIRFWSDKNWRKVNNMRETGVSASVIKTIKLAKGKVKGIFNVYYKLF